MSWRKELTRLRKKNMGVMNLSESSTANSSDEEDVNSTAEQVGEMVAAANASNSRAFCLMMPYERGYMLAEDLYYLWPFTDRVLKNERERSYCCHICFHRGDYRSNHMRHLVCSCISFSSQ